LQSSKTRFTVTQLLIFQLRVALAILVVVPFVRGIVQYQGRRVPSTYMLVAITFILPLVAIIFLLNERNLLSTISLILFTLAGVAIGFFASYMIYGLHPVGDHLIPSAKHD